MRRFFKITAAILVASMFSSCVKEGSLIEQDNNPKGVVLKAYVDDNINNLTKTSLVNGTDIQWSASDAITAFADDTESGRYHSTSTAVESNGKRADFTMGSAPEGTTFLLALYPKDEGATMNENYVVTTNLPSTQKAVANSFASGANIALADAVNGTEGMQFYNGGALVSLTVNNDNIKRIELSATGEYAYMAGDCTMNFYGSGDERIVQCQSTYEEKIESIALKGDFVNGGTYYFVLLPGEYENPKLKITNNLGQSVTLKNSTTLELNSNDNYYIADLPDLSEALAKKPCIAEFDFTDLEFVGISASDFESSAYAVTGKSFSASGVTLSFTQAEGKTANRIWSSNNGYDLRLYEDATMTYTAPDGYVIDRITFVGAAIGGFKNYTSPAYMYDNTTKTGVLNCSGEDNVVTFTIPNGGTKLSTACVEFSRIDPTKPYLALSAERASGDWNETNYNFVVTSKNISDLVIAGDSEDEDIVSVVSTADTEDNTKTNVAVTLNKSFNDAAAATHVINITSALNSSLNKTFTITQGKAPALGMTLKVGTDAAVNDNVNVILASDAGSSKNVVVTTNYTINTVVSDESKIGITNHGSTYTISAIGANTTEEQLVLGTVTFTDESGVSHVATVKQNAAAGTAPEGTILFKETYTGCSTGNGPTSPSTSGSTVWGEANITYSISGSTTKNTIYNDNIGGGTAPEVLIYGTYTISGIPSGGNTSLELSFHANANATALAVASTTTGVTVSDRTAGTTDTKLYTATITLPSGTTTFNLTFTRTSNTRLDDIQVRVPKAPETLETPVVTLVGGESTTASQLKFQWPTIENATGYKAVCKTTDTAPAASDFVDITTEESGDNTIWTKTGLAAETTYYVWVIAVGDGSSYLNSAASDRISGTTAESSGGDTKTKKTVELKITSGVTANGTIKDENGNTWTVSSDGSYTSNNSYIQVGTGTKEVSYLKLSCGAYKDIEKVQVWGTSKANSSVTPKINIDGVKVAAASSAYSSQNASSGGTEFSHTFDPRKTVSSSLEIEISRSVLAKGAIYFNKLIVTYYE